MKKIQVGTTEVYYDPKNMTEEQAVLQAQAAAERALKIGSRLCVYTARIPRKGETWREKLCEYRVREKRA